MLCPRILAVTAAALVVAAPLRAQQDELPPPNTEFQIQSIDTAFQSTPDLKASGYDKKARGGSSKAGKWLEVEVTFDWTPRKPEPKYLDDLEVNTFILLSNKTRENPKGTLLTGSVAHVHTPQGKGMHSVVYVEPRALERLFDGKLPVNVRQAVEGVGVTITRGGTVVAEKTTQGRGQWWTEFEGVSGMVLNKSQTPFAHLAWDYHEPVKDGK
jgi:hypothetical protein